VGLTENSVNSARWQRLTAFSVPLLPTALIGNERHLERQSELNQNRLDLDPSLFGLGAALTEHHEVVGIAHEAKADFVQMPVEPVEDDVGQQRGDDASYTKDNFEFRRVISFQRKRYKR
jgi:hypothetical protein